MLDWQYLSKGLPEAAEEGQENFYAAYLANRDYAWWVLGVSKNNHDLSPSMQYLYKIAATFVNNLIRTPGLELLREKAVVALDDHDGEILLAEIPYLLGAEHLDRHWLDCAWDKLHQVYDQEIKKHSGSINEYFRNMNPNIHVAGKVYFHLVESQREDYPFAFLATYAAESQTGGSAKHLPLKNALKEYGENSHPDGSLHIRRRRYTLPDSQLVEEKIRIREGSNQYRQQGPLSGGLRGVG